MTTRTTGRLSRFRKTIAAVLGAGGTWCVAALPGGVTEMEWVALGIAVATALGVYSLPNDGPR
jgi:hypothetical protein